jgi:hypothetical protein
MVSVDGGGFPNFEAFEADRLVTQHGQLNVPFKA